MSSHFIINIIFNLLNIGMSQEDVLNVTANIADDKEEGELSDDPDV